MNREYYSKVKCWCVKQWRMKYLDKTAFGLVIHIYRNESHKYLALSWAYYRDKMLSRYIIKDSLKRKVLFNYRSASLLGSFSQTPLEMGYIRRSHVFDTMTTLLCTLLYIKLNEYCVENTVNLFCPTLFLNLWLAVMNIFKYHRRTRSYIRASSSGNLFMQEYNDSNFLDRAKT